MFDWTSEDPMPLGTSVRERNRAWARVSRRDPCPVCGKPDWCTVSGQLVCCMRVESQYPSRNDGWLHAAGDTGKLRELAEFTPRVYRKDCPQIVERWGRATTPEAIAAHAAQLGLPADALGQLGVVWSAAANAWGWPMRNECGEIIGIRLRESKDEGAQKWAVTASRQGLFIPASIIDAFGGPVLFICEGPTDTAAAWGLGLEVIGRPAASGQREMICEFVLRLRPRPRLVVLLYDGEDADAAGRRGAERLADDLSASVNVCLVSPPAGVKDVRRWVRSGAKRSDIRGALTTTPYYRRGASG